MPREGRLDAPHTGPRRALLPHLHRVVVTPGDEASIRKDRHAHHVTAVPREGRHRKTRCGEVGVTERDGEHLGDESRRADAIDHIGEWSVASPFEKQRTAENP